MNARRTAVRLTFAGVDISTDINKHLLSLTYTDNEEDKTDDLQLSLDDREGVWLGNWLNTPGASKGVEISAVIVQKNWESNGKDRVLDCGVFEIDTVDGSGPPAKATIKAVHSLQVHRADAEENESMGELHAFQHRKGNCGQKRAYLYV